jgi:single-strand selective monofunctional uracil DNA glycosylase
VTAVVDAVLAANDALRRDMNALSIGAPVAYVYNPLDYAGALVEAYVRRYGSTTKKHVLLGMNPGPWGMAQTGVPFGEVSFVRDWMKLDGVVTQPQRMHPKRPVQGLACTRSEVSGKRLWGAIAARHPSAATFFADAFVINYCPLLFLVDSGANFTPDKLDKKTRLALEAACDVHLRAVLQAFAPKTAIGVGAYASKCLTRVGAPRVVTLPHPSPASPQANAGWAPLARQALEGGGVEPFL